MALPPPNQFFTLESVDGPNTYILIITGNKIDLALNNTPNPATWSLSPIDPADDKYEMILKDSTPPLFFSNNSPNEDAITSLNANWFKISEIGSDPNTFKIKDQNHNFLTAKVVLTGPSFEGHAKFEAWTGDKKQKWKFKEADDDTDV